MSRKLGACHFSVPSLRVIRSLEQVIEWCGKPSANDSEYISQTLVDWANKHHITLMYIQPGKPTKNAYVERFNRTVRHEWLELHLFESIEQAQEWPQSGFGYTIMNDLIMHSDECHQGI